MREVQNCKPVILIFCIAPDRALGLRLVGSLTAGSGEPTLYSKA